MRYTDGSAAIEGLGTIVLAPTAGSYDAKGVSKYCPPTISTFAGATLDGAV